MGDAAQSSKLGTTVTVADALAYAAGCDRPRTDEERVIAVLAGTVTVQLQRPNWDDLRAAIVDLMDGVYVTANEIQRQTGLPIERCKELMTIYGSLLEGKT